MPRTVKHFRQLLAFSLILAAGMGIAPPRGMAAGFDSSAFQPFFFVETSDPHLTNASTRSNFRELGSIANRIQAPFVLVAGDMGSSNIAGDWSGWDSCLDAFQMPLMTIPGNHDVFSTATLQAYRAHFGPDYYAFTYNNCAVVCLDSSIMREPALFKGEYEAAWSWLERTLAEAAAARRHRIYILVHYPPYGNWEGEGDNYYSFYRPERARLLSLARAYRVSAIMAGHQHYTLAYPANNPPLYITGGTGYVFDNKGPGFRIYKVGRLRDEQFYVRMDQSDWEAPAPPGRPWVRGRTPASLTLEWAPASDNVGVLRYAVLRDGVLLGHTLEEMYADTGPTSGQLHRYTVVAVDTAGNSSPASPTLEAEADGSPGAVEPVLAGSGWRYLDGGEAAPEDWIQPNFDDRDWRQGLGQFGWGEGDEATTLTLGPAPPSSPPPVTVYFRRVFDVANPTSLGLPTLNLLCGDGAVVYLNGREAGRWNMPAGPVAPSTPALRAAGGAEANTWRELPLDRSLLLPGLNVVAVEVHLASPARDRLSFDLKLAAAAAVPGLTTLGRGPYLQNVTTTAATVRWRTATPVIGRVACGVLPGRPVWQVTDLEAKTDHELRLTGLAPDTRYIYQVETGAQVLAGGDGSCTLATPPPAGMDKPTRIWVVGDSGTGNSAARQVRDAYAQFTGARATDLWLMLGDNAYPSGTDADHQAKLFDTYPAMLRKVAPWPVLGNHDTYSTLPGTAIHPYFDIFTLPVRGEAGGVPSGTEAYYSITYGNTHLVFLDSSESDRSPTGPMLSWLKADLAATRALWLIACFHHPPYSKGSHDSDSPADDGNKMIEMRENALPILEAAGVDLVLSGHSHSYERSYLMDGHYGGSETLRPEMIRDRGDGDPTGGGPYLKPVLRRPHQGTVYVVAGSSGQVTAGGSMNHPVMARSMLTPGSLAIDIQGRRLDARFIDNTGAIRDEFTIWKGSPQETGARDWRDYR